jgi:hypothetical protein
VGSGGIIAGLEAGLAAVPVVGWVALAGLVIAGIISGMDDGPAMRSASFGSNGGLAAGNPLFRSSSNLGSFGIFNDSWFSDKDQGPQIQQFLAGIQSIDNALAGLVDAPTLQRIKDGLAAATTTFEAGMEHEATSFGEILQQRYHTVVEAIDPELTHLVDSFQGTGAELGKFVIDVVAVHETLKTFNQSRPVRPAGQRRRHHPPAARRRECLADVHARGAGVQPHQRDRHGDGPERGHRVR